MLINNYVCSDTGYARVRTAGGKKDRSIGREDMMKSERWAGDLMRPGGRVTGQGRRVGKGCNLRGERNKKSQEKQWIKKLKCVWIICTHAFWQRCVSYRWPITALIADENGPFMPPDSLSSPLQHSIFVSILLFSEDTCFSLTSVIFLSVFSTKKDRFKCTYATFQHN